MGNGGWVDSFKPRAVDEVARNCARVEESVKLEVVASVFGLLLAQPPRWVCLHSHCQAHPQTPPGSGTGMGTTQVTGMEKEGLDRDVPSTDAKKNQWNRGGKRQSSAVPSLT